MDDAFLVGGFERLADLPRDLECRIEREGPVRETIRQGGPGDQLHHDGVHAPAISRAVNRGDVRMVEGGKQASLVLPAA